MLMLVAGLGSGWAQQPRLQVRAEPATQQPSLTVDRDPVASPDPDAAGERGWTGRRSLRRG